MEKEVFITLCMETDNMEKEGSLSMEIEGTPPPHSFWVPELASSPLSSSSSYADGLRPSPPTSQDEEEAKGWLEEGGRMSCISYKLDG